MESALKQSSLDPNNKKRSPFIFENGPGLNIVSDRARFWRSQTAKDGNRKRERVVRTTDCEHAKVWNNVALRSVHAVEFGKLLIPRRVYRRYNMER